MAGLLSGARLEGAALHRFLRFWWLAAYAVWLVFVRLEQPAAFVRARVPFFWAAAEVALLLAIAFLPLLWVLARGAEAAHWTRRCARRPGRGVLISWLGIVGYGTCGAFCCALLALAVHGIGGPRLALGCAGALWIEAVLWIAPLASLAPGLSLLRVPAYGAVLSWAVLVAGSLLRGVPIPTGSLLILQGDDLTMAPWRGSAVLPVFLATAGGLSFSTALARRRVRRTERCGSESSATFTATSKP